MTRNDILATAEKIVSGERKDKYGKQEDSFRYIADLWGAFIRDSKCDETGEFQGLSPQDVALMMILMKVARASTGVQQDDTWIDIAGYASLGGEM